MLWLISAVLNCLVLVSSVDVVAQTEFQADIRDAKGIVVQGSAQLDAQTARLKAADQRIDQISNSLQDLEFEIDQLENDRTLRTDRDAELAALIGESMSDLVWLIRATRDLEIKHPIELLLLPESIESIERITRYHQHMIQARVKLVSNLRTQLDNLDTNRQELQTTITNLRTRRTELTDEAQSLENERLRRRDVITHYRNLVSTNEQKLLSLERQQQALALAIANVPIETYSTNALSVKHTDSPRIDGTIWPVVGEIQNRFGEPRAEGQLSWEGIYFIADKGTTIHAVADGRVLFANWIQGLGNTMIIQHTDALVSFYGYADALFKNIGETIVAGDVIGVVGTSGGQPVEGLYFEIRQNNTPTDPIAWLEK